MNHIVISTWMGAPPRLTSIWIIATVRSVGRWVPTRRRVKKIQVEIFRRGWSSLWSAWRGRCAAACLRPGPTLIHGWRHERIGSTAHHLRVHGGMVVDIHGGMVGMTHGWRLMLLLLLVLRWRLLMLWLWLLLLWKHWHTRIDGTHLKNRSNNEQLGTGN